MLEITENKYYPMLTASDTFKEGLNTFFLKTRMFVKGGTATEHTLRAIDSTRLSIVSRVRQRA